MNATLRCAANDYSGVDHFSVDRDLSRSHRLPRFQSPTFDRTDAPSTGVTYATPSEVPINEGGEVEDEAVARP